jgi:hypothetical protein
MHGAGSAGPETAISGARVLAPISTEVRANTFTTGPQDGATVAHLDDGSFGVFWWGDQPDATPRGLDGIWGRVYRSDGRPVASAETLVDTRDVVSNIEPDAVRAAPGQFAVLWREYDNGDFPDDELYVRLVDSEQGGVATPIKFADAIGANDFHQSVSGTSPDGFVVAWTRTVPAAGPEASQIVARRDAAAQPATAEVVVTPSPENAHRGVSARAGRESSLCLMELSQDGDRDAVLLKRFNADGSPSSEAQVVNTYTTANQQFPRMGALPDGRFLIAWDSFGQDGDREGVFAQRFSATGKRVGSEFQVNSYTTGSQFRNAIVSHGGSFFSVVWLSDGQDGDGLGVFARLFDWDSGPLGTEFKVNSYTVGDQGRGFGASSDAVGNIVVVWSGDDDGSRSGVFARRYCLADPADIRCGNNTGNAGAPPTASDALAALATAVGLSDCLFCECDADGSGHVSSSDALRILKAAAGDAAGLSCPACCLTP